MSSSDTPPSQGDNTEDISQYDTLGELGHYSPEASPDYSPVSSIGPTGEQIIVGCVIRAHGLNGQMRVKVLSDVPQRFQAGGVVYINGTAFTIAASGFFRHGQILLTLHGIDDSAAAQKMVEQMITVPAEAAPPLPEGEWFHFQLLGLKVLTDQGEALGEITDILETGSNDVYVVSEGKSEILIPALKSVINEVRLDDGVMVVSLPNGLR